MNTDPRTEYLEMVNNKCIDYKWELSEHVKEVMMSLLMTRDKVWQGGDFVQAVLSNDLGGATRRADSEMINYLRHMVIARDNFFLGQDW